MGVFESFLGAPQGIRSPTTLRRSCQVGVKVLWFPFIILLAPFAVGPAWAQDVLTEAEAALERWDSEEAYRLAQSVPSQRPQDAAVLALLLKASLYRGEYLEAARWGERWIAVEPSNEYAKGWKAFAEQTAGAVQDLTTYTSPHFMVRLQEERDAILAEYVLAALEKAYEELGRDLGHRPTPRRSASKSFLDHERFHAASSPVKARHRGRRRGGYLQIR